MANSLYNQLNQNQPSKTDMNTVQSNPQVQSIINEVRNSGMSPKDYFFHKASEMGVNPMSVLQQLR